MSAYDKLKEEPSRQSHYGSMDSGSSRMKSESVRFFDLCDDITTNLFSINRSATILEKAFKQIGTPQDSQLIRDRITQVNATAGEKIQETTNILRSANCLSETDKLKRIRVQKLQREFKASATRFSSIQNRVVNLIRNARLPADAVPLELENENASEDQQSMQSQVDKKEEESMQYEIAMQQERQQQVELLEHDIVDLNEIMRELSSMVNMQAEAVSSIEENVETAHGYVEEGRVELIQAAEYQSKRRRRCCLCMMISVVIFIIIIIIIAIHYTNAD